MVVRLDVCGGDERVPGHLGQRGVAGQVASGGAQEDGAIGRVGGIRGVPGVVAAVMAVMVGLGDGGGGLVLKVGHQHGSCFDIDHAIAACLDVFEGRGVNGD